MVVSCRRWMVWVACACDGQPWAMRHESISLTLNECRYNEWRSLCARALAYRHKSEINAFWPISSSSSYFSAGLFNAITIFFHFSLPLMWESRSAVPPSIRNFLITAVRCENELIYLNRIMLTVEWTTPATTTTKNCGDRKKKNRMVGLVSEFNPKVVCCRKKAI